MDFGLAINFLLALSIGAIIGLEREITHQKIKIQNLGGIRTFILISIFSFILTHLTINVLDSIIGFIVGFIVFMLMVIAMYATLAIKTGKISVTTEITAIITFLLSAIVTAEMTSDLKLFAIIIAVIVASILALKRYLHRFARHITNDEVYAAIKMALISIIILPFLPNVQYSLLDFPIIKNALKLVDAETINIISQINVFNPFKIWLFVVFISGLSFIGYILVRTVGAKKGVGMVSFLGGIVSSTAVTVSLSQGSKNKKYSNVFVFGILLASSVMFVRVLILISVLSADLLRYTFIPIALMALLGFIASFIFSRLNSGNGDEHIELETPFAIVPALKFAVFLVFILIISKLLYIFVGDKGVYIAGLVSGLADVDAITLTLSSLSFSGVLAAKVASIGIILAVCANTLVKGLIAFIAGNKKVGRWVIVLLFIILVIGVISAIFAV